MSDRRYPLCWPEGWKRTPYGQRGLSKYKVTDRQAVEDLARELRLLGGDKAILSSNLMTRIDGMPLAKQRLPEDPGVAVYFERDGQTQVIACDVWRTVFENIRAITLAIEALRQLDRCGASEIMNRAFKGFAALPAQATVAWRSELGFGDGFVSKDQIEAAYRERARRCHPDAGGSSDDFIRLGQAKDAALREIAS